MTTSAAGSRSSLISSRWSSPCRATRPCPAARRSPDDCQDHEHQGRRSLKRETITHLGTLNFNAGKENAVFLGPPGTGKTHLSIGLGIRTCQTGHRVAFATAAAPAHATLSNSPPTG
ncbi:ATP-binding protein [Amycolatopsis sp.]|uniref:ATP-binding protein n=1 Tax=Amycolatopsis sp. TaxID=37632 RepID=UPI0039C87A73